MKASLEIINFSWFFEKNKKKKNKGIQRVQK